MCNCAQTVSSLGSAFLGIATSLAILCLFAPFWQTTEAPTILNLVGFKSASRGIYLECSDPYTGNRECNWIKFDDQPEWFQAVMVMWALGAGLLLLVEIASFVICCESCKTPRYAAFISFATLFGALSLLIAAILYGVKTGDKWDRDNRQYFDWGFYLAIGAAGFAILAVILFGSSIHCLRSNHS